ncbi:MAG: hypothetical protein ACQGVK_01945 [Myxococcota bacterium]
MESDRGIRSPVRKPGTLEMGLALGLALLAGCGPSPDEAALARGLGYFASEVSQVDPGWANLFGYMHRRFGLEAWNASGAALHEVPLDQARPEMAAVFRRLVDPSAGISAARIAALPAVIDRITATGLHCDRIGLPRDWVSVLSEASRLGGYALTHAAVAGEWSVENGCIPRTEIGPLQAVQIDRLTDLASDAKPLDRDAPGSLDRWVEALVTLHYLGAGERVPAHWVKALVAAQRSDGGWPNRPRAATSDPHTTALALWVLLEATRPGTPAIRWVPAP